MSSISITPMPQVERGFTFDPALLPDDAEGQALAERIYSLLVPYAELCQRKRDTDIASYSSEHQALVQERRKLKEREDELLVEHQPLSTEALEINTAFRQSRFNLKMVKESAPDPKWATQSDWDQYNTQVAAAENAFEEISIRQAAHNLKVNEWQDSWNEVQDLIKNLVEEVSKVWDRLQAAKGSNVHAINPTTVGLPK